MLESILSRIIQQDQAVFLWVNQKARFSLLDALMPLFSDLNPYFPIMSLIIVIAVIRWGRRSLLAITAAILLLGFTNTINSHVLKPAIGRPRPYETLSHVRFFDHGWRETASAHTPNLSGTISFPSSHAVNAFAAATFLGSYFPPVRVAMLIVASAVAFSRLYTGVHYPSDVLFGALLGVLSALLFLWLIKGLPRWFPRFAARFRIVPPGSDPDPPNARTDRYWPGLLLAAAGAWMLWIWDVPMCSYSLVRFLGAACVPCGLLLMAVNGLRGAPIRGERVLLGLILAAALVAAVMYPARASSYEWGKRGNGASWSLGGYLVHVAEGSDYTEFVTRGPGGFLFSRPLYFSPKKVHEVRVDMEIPHVQGSDHVGLYYDLGDGFTAEQVVFIKARAGRNTYTFPLFLNTTLFRLRLDPTLHADVRVKLFSLRVQPAP